MFLRHSKELKFREDADLIPAVHAAAYRGAHRFAIILLASIGSFIAIMLFWANNAMLDEVTRGEGKVIPSRQIQVVQNLEGGILAEMLVREGEVVEEGQVLLRIDNTTAQSDYAENKVRYWALKSRAARLRAESEGKDVEMPKDVLEKAPRVATSEMALYQARKASLTSEVSILKRQVEQRRQQILELKSQVRQFSAQRGSIRRELGMSRPLVAQGAVSQVEILRLEREEASIDGQLQSSRLAIPRARAALQESIERIKERRITARAEARRELSQVQADLAVVAESVSAGLDRVTRTEVRSPVRGTIKLLKKTTLGGVVRPGEDLVEIVPLEDTLLIEARIRPSDVAFLRPGQKVIVKITAYDFSIYGGLEGEVVAISADTIQDEQQRGGGSFYRIRVRTKQTWIGRGSQKLPIIPGMTASVDILTGEKTVLDYLLKPIMKARTQALRER